MKGSQKHVFCNFQKTLKNEHMRDWKIFYLFFYFFFFFQIRNFFAVILLENKNLHFSGPPYYTIVVFPEDGKISNFS